VTRSACLGRPHVGCARARPDAVARSVSSAVWLASAIVVGKQTGFAQPSQLRYDAFPYQKYGSSSGVIVSVGRSPFAPGELPSHLASTILSSMSVNQTSEALYRLKVKIQNQTVWADGKEYTLKPGMTLNADVKLENRRVWEWLAGPLFSYTRR